MHVTPTSVNRRDFARWAIANRVRTSSSNTFDVPDDLFVAIPAAVLDGALINGQPYVPSTLDVDGPDDDLLGVADPFVVDEPDFDTSPLYTDPPVEDDTPVDVVDQVDVEVDTTPPATEDDDALVVPF